MFNINTGNLNLLFSSVSYCRINYLVEIYWIVADKSDIWKIDFGYIHLKLEFFLPFFFFFFYTLLLWNRNHPSQDEFHFIDNCFNCSVSNYYRH